jgi:hypothetical protein
MTTLAELDAFVRQLENHDWTYEFSDDGGKYRDGQNQRMQINREARKDAVLMAAFNTYYNYHFPPHAISNAWPDKKLVRDSIIEGLRHDLKVAATVELISSKEAA